jgi:hypothetical protein
MTPWYLPTNAPAGTSRTANAKSAAGAGPDVDVVAELQPRSDTRLQQYERERIDQQPSRLYRRASRRAENLHRRAARDSGLGTNSPLNQ